MQVWVALACGALLCMWFIRRDWPRLPPGGPRRRVLTLCVLTFLAFFGGLFLLFVVTGSVDVADTNWYEPTLQRLTAQQCPTAPLDAADQHFGRTIGLFGKMFAAGWTATSSILSMAWQNARRRYLR